MQRGGDKKNVKSVTHWWTRPLRIGSLHEIQICCKHTWLESVFYHHVCLKNKSKFHRTTLFQSWTEYLPIWLLCSVNEPKRSSWIGNIAYTIADSLGDIHALLWRATLFFGRQLIPWGKTQAKTATQMLGLMDRYPKIRQIIGLGNTKK
jgi:hypothetical protein